MIIGGVASVVLLAIVTGLLVVARTDLVETRSALADTRLELNDATAAIEQTREERETAETELSSARTELSDLQDDLRSTEQTLRSASKCSLGAMAAWFETLNSSYDATGRALGRIVYSSLCRIPRLAYRQMGDSATGTSWG